jgi:hypothetical protein
MTDFQPRFRQCLHTAVRARHSQLQLAKAENLAKFNATPATQCRSNRVSRRRLPETGIFQISARDYRRFLPGRGHIWSLETDRQFAKACHWRAFLALPRAKSQSAGLVGWRRSADRASLRAISLLSGNLTGNFANLRHLEADADQETAVPQPLIEQFPTQANREIISGNRDF